MLLEAFLFGLTVALAIGPIALLILNTGINHGLRAALACGAGAAFADFVFALAAFLGGAALFALLDAHRGALSTIASLLLCALGVWMLVLAWRSRNRRLHAAAPPSPGFMGTWLLTLANPLTVLFFVAWMGSRGDVSWQLAFAGALAVCAGSLLVQWSLAIAASLLRPLLLASRPRLAANLASAAGILGFGAWRLAFT